MSRTFSDRSLGAAGLVLGTIAVLISLNADAWAARAVDALARNSVTSAHIRTGAVRTADIATGGVRGVDIKNGTIGLPDLSPAIRATLGRTGAAGPAGPAGAIGATGPAGSPGEGLTDGSITTARLANDAVTSAKIAPDTIAAVDIAANGVAAAEIATNGVAAAEIAADGVGSSEVQDGSLTAADVGSQSGFFPIDYFELDPAECMSAGFFVGTGATAGAAIVVTPGSNWPEGLTYAARPSGSGDSVNIAVCNASSAAIDPPSSTFNYVVFG